MASLVTSSTAWMEVRSSKAAAVAAQIYRSLAPRIVRTDRNLAQTEFHLDPRTATVTAAAARTTIADDEDEDDDNSVDGDAAGGDVVLVPATRPVEKKLVTRTANSKPVFPPVIITFDKDGNPMPKDEKQKQ